MIIGKDISSENKYLKTTIKNIESLLAKYVDSNILQNKEIINHRKFLWDNRRDLDNIEMNENCSQIAIEEKIHSNKLNRIKCLERQLVTPYFARLDFKEDNEKPESFYIGLSTIEDKDNLDFLVFDWRSPISNMFYDFETGAAFYKAPNKTIKGEILFNRQYNIKNGEIIFIHDSNESLCDESLVSILRNNATDKMKNIVATIQKEQNDIIRMDDSNVLFIQGAAGSGKTSIALHRSAYLLYKYRKDLKSDNILIFSPNEVFVEYISDVLPELGETNILQTTFELYSKKFLPLNYIIESKDEHLDKLYSLDKSSEFFKMKSKSMKYKNSDIFLKLLNEFLLDLPKLLMDFKPIIIDNKELVSRQAVSELFLHKFKDIPFLSRIGLIKKSLFSQIETKYLADSTKVNFDYIEDKKVFYDYCKNRINVQVDNMIKTLNPIDAYKLFWHNINQYTNYFIDDIKNFTLNYLNLGELKYEDIVVTIYIRAYLEGFRNYNNIKHILIDEAQDYSPLFYEIIKKCFSNVSITIMGDLNQRIDKYCNATNKHSITNVFPNSKSVALTKSYRSTANITNFSREILDTYEPIEAVNRVGNPPSIYISNTNLEGKILGIINDMLSKNLKSIAIICKTKNNSNNIFSNLKTILPSINLIDNSNCEFKLGINVITSYIAKGLEFDGVIIADGEEYLNENNKNIFYTVCTRALHELHILSKQPLETILPKDKNLYILK